MPIISIIGSKSIKTRLLYGFIYVLLSVGAITMIYPLSLMLSGSVKSDADTYSVRPYPEFWFNEQMLFRKYVETKYNCLFINAQNAWGKRVINWRIVENPGDVPQKYIDDMREWRRTIPVERRSISFMKPAVGKIILAKNLRSYKAFMMEKFSTLDNYNRMSGQLFVSWNAVTPPAETIGRVENQSIPRDYLAEFIKWKGTISADDQNIEYARPHYALYYLPGQYTSKIAEYNKQHKTDYPSYAEIELPARIPAKESLERNDWIKFVRNEIKLKFIQLDTPLEKPFREFLVEQYSSISEFNSLHKTEFLDFSQVPFPRKIYDALWLSIDLEKFVKSEKCQLEYVSIYDFNDEFKDFLAGKYGEVPGDYPGLGPVQSATEWKDCMENSAAVRWELTKRNYIQVFDYLAMHGNGFINTVIFCALAVLTKLIVNPMAAYALSRFNLPSTYKILLFCMATMAFPHEVTMIPSFLLLKRFPLYPLMVTVAVTLVAFKILEKLMPSAKEGYKALSALFLGLLAGAVFMPRFFPELTTVSLLNSFAALILPGMANGYSIFLLKGFFDSMPKELYEAADIDGAGEWTKFWLLTMNLSKPILAVLALAAFTHAYSSFMQALIIIPDQKMWTIMVWVYQLQAQSTQPVVYASLVLAAIPTLLIFILCQNVIMRGIVVPTEK